jgi:DnaJ-class molecular chaperone
MINYYQILDVKKTDDQEYINKKYNKKILKYKNLPFLNSEQKEDVKNLKIAVYILTNEELKNLYDNYLKSLKINNDDKSDNFDNFSDKYVSLKKKELKDVDNKYLSDRLFSIPINQNSNFFENEARLRS